MKITQQNYEAWLLDALEGNLDNQGLKELNDFLEQNPELASDHSAFTPYVFRPDDSVLFPHKEKLLKKGRTINISILLTRTAAALFFLILGAGLARIFWKQGDKDFSLRISELPSLTIDKTTPVREGSPAPELISTSKKLGSDEILFADEIIIPEDLPESPVALERRVWTAPENTFTTDPKNPDLELLEPDWALENSTEDEESGSLAGRFIRGQASNFLPQALASRIEDRGFRPDRVTIEVNLPRRKLWEKLFESKKTISKNE